MISRAYRLEELLVLRATQPLSTTELAELETLLKSDLASDTEIFDRAAAAIHVAAMRSRRTLPPGLRARLEQQAASHLSSLTSNAKE